MNQHRPTRATRAGQAYLDLQNLARRQHRPTDELLQLYALEGFLARLAASPHADRLVLKGGVLLAAYDTRRPTRDIDLHARTLPNDVGKILELVRSVADAPVEDGLALDTTSARAEPIRDNDLYSGVRVSLTGRLASAQIHFHVDVNVGDPVWPPPARVILPCLLGGQLELMGYPLAMVHAEKLATAVHRGMANTRWRGFADVYLLAGRHDLAGVDLEAALVRVSEHRRVTLVPLQQALDGYADHGQRQWSAWRRHQRLDNLPNDFGNILQAVIAFADPALRRTVGTATWRAASRRWQRATGGRAAGRAVVGRGESGP